MSTYKEKAHNSKTFCIYPFVAVSTTPTGNIKPCCRAYDNGIGNINNNSLKEIWNNDSFKNLRKQLLNGEKSDLCKTCWNHEDIGVRSMRQRSLWLLKRQIDQLDKLDDQYTMPFEITMFEAKLSNICNLKCRMCSPEDSSALFNDWKKLKSIAPHLKDKNNSNLNFSILKWNSEKFWNEFQEIASHLTVLHFAGGEPLVDDSHYKIMDIVEPYAKNIQLDYATNLTVLNYKKYNLIDIWKKFKQIELSISLDGIDNIYNYIRQHGNYNKVKDNIKELQKYKIINKFTGHCVVQIYNIFSLTKIIDEFIEDLNINVILNALHGPKYLDMQILPKHIKEELTENLENYRNNIKNKTHPNWTDDIKQTMIRQVTEQISELNRDNISDKHLEDFILYSDSMDNIQRVKYKWRELIPELSNV